jgi:hypothetical protein
MYNAMLYTNQRGAPADRDPYRVAEIDEAKIAYLSTKGVTFDDITEVLSNAPRFFATIGAPR